jgi:hypothetical protein
LRDPTPRLEGPATDWLGDVFRAGVGFVILGLGDFFGVGAGFVRLGGVDVVAGRRSALIFGTSGADIGRAKVNKLAVLHF